VHGEGRPLVLDAGPVDTGGDGRHPPPDLVGDRREGFALRPVEPEHPDAGHGKEPGQVCARTAGDHRHQPEPDRQRGERIRHPRQRHGQLGPPDDL
jgi:hypothetical protein